MSWPVDRPFPALMTDTQLREVLEVSVSTFQRLKAAGRFKVLLAEPVLTDTARYSGVKVERWVRGELQPVRTFGGKRSA